MSFDAHSNLAWTTIAIAPSPALTGTSLTVASGTATVFPAVPFNCTLYPPTSSPSLANAEIVRVTNIAGDVLTITRAQEGTSAKPITSGYRIANTATKKTFTDIETAITALPTFAIQSLSAGTAVATGPQVVFSNSNGVSFGINGNTLTAQFSAAGGGAAISAGANSQSSGTVVFSNANSISFGMDGAGAVTASFSQNPQQAISEIYAGSQAAAFAVSFVNANGVTFGMSDNSQITASVAAGGAPGSISAGANSVALGQVVFSNSNNVTFGLNGSTVTASASNPQTTQPVAASASNGSFLFSTLGFSNANGVTFGTSGGSIVTASVNTAAASINFSAGTQSSNLDTIVFSNSNGVSFGLSNGTITASASGGAGGAATTMRYYENFGIETPDIAYASIEPNVIVFDHYALAAPLALTAVRYVGSFSAAQSTAAGSNSYSQGRTHAIGFFSRSVTDPTATNYSNSSLLALMFSTSLTISAFGSNTGTSNYYEYGLGTGSTNGSVSGSFSSNTHVSTPEMRLAKLFDVGCSTILTAGEYFMAHHVLQSTVGGANGLALFRVSFAGLSSVTNTNFALRFGEAANVSVLAPYGRGRYSATTAAMFTSVNISEIVQTAASQRPYLQLLG